MMTYKVYVGNQSIVFTVNSEEEFKSKLAQYSKQWEKGGLYGSGWNLMP